MFGDYFHDTQTSTFVCYSISAIIERALTCHCGKKYKLKQHLTRHQLVHQDNLIIRCDRCSRSFTIEDSLKDHLKICKGNVRSTLCEQCNKDFTTPWKLQRHKNSVHNPEKVKKRPGRKRSAQTETFEKETEKVGENKTETLKLKNLKHLKRSNLNVEM